MTSTTSAPVDLEKILSSLTLDEKITLLAGKNFWETFGFPEKGVPSLKTSDGPNGARGGAFVGGTTAACFPASVSLAATWDLSLASRIGGALAEETKTKGASVLLAPTVCPHRHPLGGRNFESFSEDPLLAGLMAARYITGLQSKGVGATIKHFAGNEQETQRFTVDVHVSERALREIYLKPFEIAIKSARPWAVMTSYNLVNGFHSDMNEFLLKKVLRGQWGWEGLVMSDWGGVNSTAESIAAGCDLEMPGETRWRGGEAVKAALEKGTLEVGAVDESCRNVLRLLERAGKFEHPETPEERADNNKEHQELIRHAGRSGIVLLKNKNALLPITKKAYKGKKIAVLGLAKEALIHGGGSASVNAHYKVTPWDALTAAFGDDVDLQFAKGAQTFRLLPAMKDNVVTSSGVPGWTLSQYPTHSTDGEPSKSEPLDSAAWTPLLEKITAQVVRLRGTFTPTESGDHYLGASGLGPTTVSINGEEVYSQTTNHPDFMGFLLGAGAEETFQHRFEAGREYVVELTTAMPGSNGSGLSLLDGAMGFHLGFMRESLHDADVLSEAVELARSADAALVFTGHTKDWETEGQDQLSFHLPASGSQDRLVAAVAAANGKTVVVNSTGVAVAMPWLGAVAAVVQSWFPGQEAGNAIADVLTGAHNPSGRLPVSFPRRLEDAPAYGNFPGTQREGGLDVSYEEGVFVGYRHYDRAGEGELLFPFGFGLSYTTFGVEGASVHKEGEEVKVGVEVANTGAVAGSTIIQVYAGPSFKQSVDTPEKQLVGFVKVELEAGQTERVECAFSAKQLAFFDEGSGKWAVEKGEYKVSVGFSAAHVAESRMVSVDEGFSFDA